MALVVQDQNLSIVVRVADGHHGLGQRTGAIDAKAGGAQRFRGSEPVDQQARIGKMRAKALDVLAKERIASEQHEPDRGERRAGFERAEKDAEGRDR